MTPEEHVAHAAAVKLMGDKDYYVQVFCSIYPEILKASNLRYVDKKLRCDTGGTFESAAKYAAEATAKAMVHINNYGVQK